MTASPDTPLSAALRFLVELIAWIVGPWALGRVATWLAVLAAVVLIGLPAVFSTPGDKKLVVVATPGPARMVIEALLHLTAATAPWFVWPRGVAVGCVAVVVAAVVTGVPRTRWLLRGAP